MEPAQQISARANLHPRQPAVLLLSLPLLDLVGPVELALVGMRWLMLALVRFAAAAGGCGGGDGVALLVKAMVALLLLLLLWQ
jgi:hypothetical protein